MLRFAPQRNVAGVGVAPAQEHFQQRRFARSRWAR